ncbi:MAG: hypothetical protein MASP_00072 [Candidatus Methanolliviera sp. GoM_asphalt]|nr:MAG: hypothetical protein MASP_00072 [Candidatus Methanolliviera sp. GoM_asphalt]
MGKIREMIKNEDALSFLVGIVEAAISGGTAGGAGWYAGLEKFAKKFFGLG